jgi:group I intron endonuclease
MPYANDHMGVYKVVNTATDECYVGSSRHVRKRTSEHFRLLRHGLHPNYLLQKSFDCYGEKFFKWDLEVLCEDERDLGSIEEMFLCREAIFDEPSVFNISTSAKAPMTGRNHTEETKRRLHERRKTSSYDYSSKEQRRKLSEAHTRRLLSNPAHLARIRFILDNPDMSYAERGRVIGLDTSSVRKLALRYRDHKDLQNG